MYLAAAFSNNFDARSEGNGSTKIIFSLCLISFIIDFILDYVASSIIGALVAYGLFILGEFSSTNFGRESVDLRFKVSWISFTALNWEVYGKGDCSVTVWFDFLKVDP